MAEILHTKVSFTAESQLVSYVATKAITNLGMLSEEGSTGVMQVQVAR